MDQQANTQSNQGATLKSKKNSGKTLVYNCIDNKTGREFTLRIRLIKGGPIAEIQYAGQPVRPVDLGRFMAV